jgi:hypothetical protein
LGIEICTFETRDGSMFLVYSSVDPLVMLAQPSSNEDGARRVPGAAYSAARAAAPRAYCVAARRARL